MSGNIEIWKPVNDYEGLYEVSSIGRIRSIKRATTNGKVLKPVIDKDGYKRVCLSKNNVRKSYKVHRLVAIAFVSGRTVEKRVVNHKNEIKLDNRMENLEWCTVAYNTNYNGSAYRRVATKRKKIKATKDGETFLFKSVSEAARKLGLSHGNISECAHGAHGRKSLSGYTFSFVEE